MPRRLKHLRNVFLFVLAGIMLIGCFGFGQWKISGYVTDDADNPLAGVTVVIKAKKTVTVTTGEDGKWSAAVAGDEAEITAVKEGFEFEPVVVKKASNKPVTIVGRPKLTINPASGYYEEAITVELAIAGDYAIYYTLDGSDPTAESTEYTAPFEIEETTTVKVVAINRVNEAHKQELTAEYEIHDPGIIKNGGFESGLDHWHGKSSDVQISDAQAYNGTYSVLATSRTETGSGPRQDLPADVLEVGQTIKVSAWVYYDAEGAPDERVFNLSFQDGDGWQKIVIAASGTIKKGEWGLIQSSLVIPAEVDRGDAGVFPITMENPRIFIETSWVAEVDPAKDLFDYYVDAVSVFIVEEGSGD